MNTCRFCKEVSFHPDRDGVRYGPRHFAHFACYLDAGKSLDDLHDWQVGKFPYRLLIDRGLYDQVTERLANVGKTITGRYTGTGPGNITEAER